MRDYLTSSGGAFECVNDIVSAGGDSALTLVIGLVSAAADDAQLAYVPAGPLENLISRHANDVVLIDRVVGCAERDERFKEALQFVWLQASLLPNDVVEKLRPNAPTLQ